MSGDMINRCRGCGAEVIWVKTAANSRKMPIDAEPVQVKIESSGNTFILKDGRCVTGRRVGDAFDDPDAEVIEAHESHFATCPEAGKFRKGGGNHD